MCTRKIFGSWRSSAILNVHTVQKKPKQRVPSILRYRLTRPDWDGPTYMINAARTRIPHFSNIYYDTRPTTTALACHCDAKHSTAISVSYENTCNLCSERYAVAQGKTPLCPGLNRGTSPRTLGVQNIPCTADSRKTKLDSLYLAILWMRHLHPSRPPHVPRTANWYRRSIYTN